MRYFCLQCVPRLASPRQAIPRQHEEQEPGTSTAAFTPAEFFPFKCPTCRQNITVPPDGVEEFQADFSMEAEVSGQSQRAVLCDMCQRAAEAGCQECQKRLCPTCRHIHDQFKGAPLHSLTALNPHLLLPEKTPASSKKSRGQRRTVCKIHARDCTLYCRQCDVALCSQCLATSHGNHATENLATRMEQMRVDVRGLLQKVVEEARLMSLSGSFHDLQSQKEDMEASLSPHPAATAGQPEAGGGATDIVFRRCSSAKDTLQTAVPKFVGEVSSFDADTHLQNDSAWGFPLQQCNTPTSFFTTANGLTALSSSGDVLTATEFHPGNEARVKFASFPIDPPDCGPFSSVSLPSSDILLLSKYSCQAYVGPDFGNLISRPVPFSRIFIQYFLSHDSLPNGRNAYVCYKKFESVCEIQELVYNPPGNLISRPVFQIVCNTHSIVAFDVSSDAKYFAVLEGICFEDNQSQYFRQFRVSVFERMKAEPCAVFLSPKAAVDPKSPMEGDVCFASYKGKEMLRVAVYHEDAVYSLDFRHDCALVGRTPLDRPVRVRTDPAGRIWVVCESHVVAFNSC